MKTATEKKIFDRTALIPKRKEKLPTSPLLFLTVVAVIFTLFAVISPKTVINTSLSALKNFAEKALPSIFLFSVSSAMLVKSGFGDICKKTVGRPFRKLFALNGSLCAAFILGAIGGFPLGAKTASELYKEEQCTKAEAERALPLCSNPGIGFTVAAVGETMLGSTVTGVKLWLSCLMSSIAISALTPQKHTVIPRELPNPRPFEASKKADRRTATEIVTEAISESANTSLRICGFAVFFKTVSAVFSGITASLPIIPQNSTSVFAALTSCFFEFSSGILTLSQTLSNEVTVTLPFALTIPLLHLLTASALVWSGISVHMQITAFATPLGLDLKKYYSQKILSAASAPVCYTLISYTEHFLTNL